MKSFILTALAVLAQAQTTNTLDTSFATKVTAGTSTVPNAKCIAKGPFAYGYPDAGTRYGDFTYLAKNESPDHVYRLRGISLCVDSDTKKLQGMQAKVGVYSNIDTSLVKVVIMSKIGTVDTGTCTSITVDPLKNEYITSMTLRWG